VTRRIPAVAFSVCVLAAGWPSPVQSQSLIQTVRGQVRKQLADGRLIEGSVVSVSLAPSLSPQAPTRSAITGWDGFYYFQNVPPGSYMLSVVEKGSPPQTFKIDLRQASYADVPPVVIPARLSDFRTVYKNARRAVDLEDWSAAAYVLAQVLKLHPEDAKSRKEQIRISGNWLEPYRPHLYLGLALFRLGDCTGALREWQLEESLGPLERTYRDKIRPGRTACAKAKS
jgi:hypothetical protein